MLRIKNILKIKNIQTSELLYIIFTLIVSISFIYSYHRINTLNKEIETLDSGLLSLKDELASTTKKIEDNLSKNYTALSNNLNEQKQSVGNIEQKLGTYQEQVGNISGTVNTLQKLSKTDQELLQKYSKVFFLNEYYAPARLIEITSEYKYSDLKTIKIHNDVWPYLKRMLDDAKNNNIKNYIYFLFISFNL